MLVADVRARMWLVAGMLLDGDVGVEPGSYRLELERKVNNQPGSVIQRRAISHKLKFVGTVKYHVRIKKYAVPLLDGLCAETFSKCLKRGRQFRT